MNWFSGKAYVLATSMTWVRAPGLHAFNIIFQLMFLCSFNVGDHYTPPNQASHAYVESDPRALIERTIWSLVKRATCYSKSPPGFAIDGPELLEKNLTIGDNTPLRFAISFIFFYYCCIFF